MIQKIQKVLTAQVEQVSLPGGVSPSVSVWGSRCSWVRSPYSWRAPEMWVCWTESWWSAPGRPASPLEKEKDQIWLLENKLMRYVCNVCDCLKKSHSVSCPLQQTHTHRPFNLAHPSTTCLWGSGQEKWRPTEKRRWWSLNKPAGEEKRTLKWWVFLVVSVQLWQTELQRHTRSAGRE